MGNNPRANRVDTPFSLSTFHFPLSHLLFRLLVVLYDDDDDNNNNNNDNDNKYYVIFA